MSTRSLELELLLLLLVSLSKPELLGLVTMVAAPEVMVAASVTMAVLVAAMSGCRLGIIKSVLAASRRIIPHSNKHPGTV